MTEKKKILTLPKRRLARIIALQVLYACEMVHIDVKTGCKQYTLFEGTVPAEDLEINEDQRQLLLFVEDNAVPDGFALKLLNTIDNHKDEIDDLLRMVIERWQIERLSVIDRNILRLGVAELMNLEDIPPKVSINEYIEISKLFGDRESASFVNGILDRIAREFSPKNFSY